MKSLKTLPIFILTILCVPAIIAQTKFEVPQNVVLKADKDFAKYEPDIIKASKWLDETDLDKETEKRQKVNAFVLQWVSGSPDISIEINEPLTKIYGENAQLISIYLASYSKYYIENKGSATKQGAIKAGLTSMMNVYNKGIQVVKTKEMDKLIAVNAENKLDDYIKKHF